MNQPGLRAGSIENKEKCKVFYYYRIIKLLDFKTIKKYKIVTKVLLPIIRNVRFKYSVTTEL